MEIADYVGSIYWLLYIFTTISWQAFWTKTETHSTPTCLNWSWPANLIFCTIYFLDRKQRYVMMNVIMTYKNSVKLKGRSLSCNFAIHSRMGTYSCLFISQYLWLTGMSKSYMEMIFLFHGSSLRPMTWIYRSIYIHTKIL